MPYISVPVGNFPPKEDDRVSLEARFDSEHCFPTTRSASRSASLEVLLRDGGPVVEGLRAQHNLSPDFFFDARTDQANQHTS
jgi:hypothetical protein